MVYGFFDDLPEEASDLNKIDPQIQQQVNDMTTKSPLSTPSEMQFDNLATIPDTICYKGPIPAYPTGVFGHASNWLGDTLYFCGGTTSCSSAVYRYSLLSDSWSTGVSMPELKTGGSLVKCGNALYYIGGGTAISGIAQTASTLRYRVGIGWDLVAPIPTPVVGNAAVSYGDSVIYCLLGGWTQYYRQVQVYRPSSNTWSRGSDSLPAGAGRRSLAGGIVGNKIYIACGFSGAFRKDMYVGTIGADANSIAWVLGPAVPCRGTGMSRPGGVGIDGHFYVVGAETTPAPTRQDSIFMFNTTSGTWLTPLSGRGTGASSNYWGSVSAREIDGRVNVFIPGGSLAGTTTWGMYVARSGGCSISQTSTLALTINFEVCNSTDTIDVELRSTTAPFALVESKSGLGGLGIANPIQFANAFDGTLYYIVIRHRNSIETWSKTGGEVFTAGSLTYDFTSAASQAFGNNMVLVGSDYSFYTGDVQQDGSVDVTDLVAIYNDASAFVSGYVPTDLNCDSFVDVSDLVASYNNSVNFVGVIRP